MWYGPRGSQRSEKQNRESGNRPKYGQLIFDQSARAICTRKYNLRNILKELESSIQLRMGKRFHSKRMHRCQINTRKDIHHN